MKRKILKTAWLFLLGLLLVQQGYTQCQDGYKTHVNQSIGSGTLISNHYRSEAIVGQTFISEPVYSYDNASATGYWSMMYNPPQVTAVAASDGQFLDRIQVSWKINKNTPPVTQGFKIYRDGYLIGTTLSNVFTFIDYNITPGIYYTYEITGSNVNGEGAKSSDVGYVNPNGVISGRITTFSGNSVEGAVVSLTPSNNLSVKFDGASGLYIDTVPANPNPLVNGFFTFSMWAKVSSYTSEGMLFDYGKDDDVNFWLGVENDSSIYVAMADLSGTKKVSYQLTEKYNLWHHITAVYNGRDLVLFFDGVVVGTTTLNSSNTKYANHKISIGASGDVNASNNRFNGYIDDIRLFNRVQRPSEIKKFMYYTVPKNYDGLVAYWKMDEGKGTSTINQVETARSGNLCGATFSTTEPGVKSAGISNTSGYYLIEDVNYGNGTNFTVTPNKFVSYNTALEFNDIESNYAVTSAFQVKDSATIELWFNPYHYNGTQYLLSSNGSTPFDVFLEGNTLKLNINGQTQNIGTVYGMGYKFLTIIRERENVRTYLNGDLGTVQNLSFSYNSFIARTTWNLGRSASGTNYYSGLIDAIVIWDTPLSVTDMQLHNTLGLQDRMIVINGLTSVDERISAFIHLNDQTGTEIVNDVPYNGILEYGSVYAAEFVDIVAHEYGVDHEFDPNSRIVTLNNSTTAANGIDFTDITTVPVSGVFKYENTNCYIQYAEVKVNGASTMPPTYTNANGEWTIDLEPGATAQISINYMNHEIFPTPIFEIKNVQSPKAGILFVDKDKRSVSGVVAGGTCKYNMTPAGGTATVTLASTNGCFTREFVIADDNTSGAYSFTNVPPLEYTVSVTQHTLSFVKDFFDDLGGTTINLASENATDIDFIYRSFHNVEVSPLDTNACGEVLLHQGVPTSVTIKVYEDYLGQRCYLETAELSITDGIGHSANSGFTGNATMTSSSFTYSFFPGEANIVAPYLKSTQIIADVNGATATASFEAVVLGKKKRETTFTTTTPQMPVSILRDPPGDGSNALLETNQEVCMSNIKFKHNSLDIGWAATVDLGADITTSVGLGFSTEFEIDATVQLAYTGSLNNEGGVTNEATHCVSFSSLLETSPDLIGQEGDIYMGTALNLEYGITDVLIYNTDSCSFNLLAELTVDPKGFDTYYMYSEYHLLNDVIPSNYLLGDTASAQAWEDFVALNQTTKDNAMFSENRSFDAGVTYSSSSTISKSQGITREFSIELDNSLALAYGVTVNGIGVVLGASFDMSATYGGSTSSGTTKTQTVGYTLADDDIGDNFTVNIYQDKIFGTPVFKLVSGESSCPHETNTLPREGVQVLVDNAVESTKINVPGDQAATYVLYLGNTSQSDETMTYAVDLINGSNPYGAELSINGAPLVATSGGSGVIYSLIPNVGQYVTLALRRGSDPNRYDYEGIKVVLHSLCDESIVDTVTVNAHFIEPCSSVGISSPQNGWVITPADSSLMNIVVDNYDVADSDLELVRVQYRAVGTPSWVNIAEILKADLGALFTSVTWNIGTLSDDDYEIRALSQCTGGIQPNYSQVITGIIEQSPPEILGIPQPADGVYQSGDEISVSFTENINCSNIFYADMANLNNIGLYDLTINELVPADIQCIGNKITIIPQTPNQYIENHTLEVRITLIEDMVGNTLGINSTGSLIHKWDFYVNVSPVSWVGSAVDEFMYTASNHSFARVIENNGGDNVNYTIETPTYITASSTFGTLPAGGEKTIIFTVDPQLANGDYIGELVLNSSYGDEVLPLQLRVMCSPPDWSFNASQYSNNMNFSVAIDIEGFLSNDEFDIISGFIDNEVRGVANVQYVSVMNKYLAFLSVYADDADEGKDITFKIWDASECKLYTYTMETFQFSTNEQVGTPLNEETIHTLDILERQINLNAGWNWVSFNLTLNNDNCANVLSDLMYPQNGLIRNQSKYSQYFPAMSTWVGSLDTISELEMLQIKIDSAQVLEFYGRPIDVVNTVIPINTGWNWISYLPQYGMQPDIALQSLTPYNGDIVKNQYLFAQYVAGFGWIGNLSYMNPTSGFLYKSSVVDSLIYPESSTSNKSGNLQTTQYENKLRSEFESLNFVPEQFSGNMNIIGAVVSNDVNIGKENDKVLAYINGELRGVALSIPYQDTHLFFITVYGNLEDETGNISFVYYDAESESFYSIIEELNFNENDLIGLVNNEQHLTIGELIVTGQYNPINVSANRLSVNPNPVTNNAVINIYSTIDGTTELIIYDNYGKRIAQKEVKVKSGNNTVLFNELIDSKNLAQGLFMVSAIINNQHFSVKVVVK